MDLREQLRSNDLTGAVKALQEQIRGNPAKAELRLSLFQIYGLAGDWGRALTQLDVAVEIDAQNAVVTGVYRPAAKAEALRAEVFAGRQSPVVFGRPEAWMSLLLTANVLLAQGKAREAAELRDQALEAAPAAPGKINGEAFEWLADTDSRLGPMIEAVIEGQYVWVPWARVLEVTIAAPEDLFDALWARARFRWTNQGEAAGLIPVRYPGTEASADARLRLGRMTQWRDAGEGFSLGLGQRVLATNAGDYPLLDARLIQIENPAEPASPSDATAGGSGRG